jgi:hypothetical protein
MKNKSIEDLVDEALTNIRSDRKITREFLNDIANTLANDTEQLKYLSPVAAKHIETLQRSNEQLVKIINIRQKKSDESIRFSDEDTANLFDIIQGGVDERNPE